jgi:hypothetical protein
VWLHILQKICGRDGRKFFNVTFWIELPDTQTRWKMTPRSSPEEMMLTSPTAALPNAFIEHLESRRLLAAVPIPNLIGDYVGVVQALPGGDSQAITFSVTAQKKRGFSGTFTEADGSAAAFKGSVAKKGTAKINFKSTNATPKFTGSANFSLNTIGDTLSGLFFTHTGKVKSTAAFVAAKQS